MSEDTKLILQKLERVDSRLDGIETDIIELKDNVHSINLTIENEIRKNIQIIAEGHLDLSRKLDEALKIEQEKGIHIMRLNRLENDVRIIKEHIPGIA